MSHFKLCLTAEMGKNIVGFHAQVARIRPHITRNETRRFEGRGIRIFDGGDIAGFDLQLTLHIQQRFAHGRAFAAHQIAKAQFKGVKALWLVRFYHRCADFPPDHSSCPISAPEQILCAPYGRLVCRRIS